MNCPHRDVGLFVWVRVSLCVFVHAKIKRHKTQRKNKTDKSSASSRTFCAKTEIKTKTKKTKTKTIVQHRKKKIVVSIERVCLPAMVSGRLESLQVEVLKLEPMA